jgi:hypothetical protein
VITGEATAGRGFDRTVELEGGHCYTLVSVGAEAIQALHTYLYDPAGKRIGDDATSSNVSCFTACAIESGFYRFNVKAAKGLGHFRTAVLRSP